jgi:hypothetical protein
MSDKSKIERIIASAQHSNPQKLLFGICSGTTIDFDFRFKSIPILILTPMAATGTPTATIVSKDKTGNYYTGATIVTSGCDEVDWVAIGVGIEVVV